MEPTQEEKDKFYALIEKDNIKDAIFDKLFDLQLAGEKIRLALINLQMSMNKFNEFMEEDRKKYPREVK